MPEYIQDPATGEHVAPSCTCGRAMEWDDYLGRWECLYCRYEEE